MKKQTFVLTHNLYALNKRNVNWKLDTFASRKTIRLGKTQDFSNDNANIRV